MNRRVWPRIMGGLGWWDRGGGLDGTGGLGTEAGNWEVGCTCKIWLVDKPPGRVRPPPLGISSAPPVSGLHAAFVA